MTETTSATQAQGVQARYQQALEEGRFVIQHCEACGRHVHYPREVCPHCGSDQLQLVPAQGTGTVYAVTTVRRKPDAGGDLNVSLIDLDEGPRLMSRVTNRAPDQVRIGQRVRARVQQEQGRSLLVFEVEGEAP